MGYEYGCAVVDFIDHLLEGGIGRPLSAGSSEIEYHDDSIILFVLIDVSNQRRAIGLPNGIDPKLILFWFGIDILLNDGTLKNLGVFRRLFVQAKSPFDIIEKSASGITARFGIKCQAIEYLVKTIRQFFGTIGFFSLGKVKQSLVSLKAIAVHRHKLLYFFVDGIISNHFVAGCLNDGISKFDWCNYLRNISKV